MRAELLDEIGFEKEVLKRGYGIGSVKAYSFHIARFLSRTGKNISDITKEDIEGYVDDMKKSRSKSYCNIALQAIRLMLYVYSFRFDFDNAAERGMRVFLSRSNINEMLRSTRDVRERMLIEMVYGCGLDVNEVLILRREDFDLKSSIVNVNNGFRKKEIVIPKRLVNLLIFYFDKGNKEMFKGINPVKAERIFKEAGIRAGIDRVCSSTLKNSFAVHFFEDGAGFSEIEEILKGKKREIMIFSQMPLDNLNNKNRHEEHIIRFRDYDDADSVLFDTSFHPSIFAENCLPSL